MGALGFRISDHIVGLVIAWCFCFIKVPMGVWGCGFRISDDNVGLLITGVPGL